MLTHLSIQDYTLVDTLTLDMRPNMTAITGETGAGKSLVLDALDLCLGARADKHCVRTGQARADLSASFDITDNAQAQAWLDTHALATGCDECILRRTIDSDGRSRSFINGKPTPAQLTRELGALLVSIHGQHEHQNLLKRDAQRAMLDNFAQHTGLLCDVSDAYHAWRAAQDALDSVLAREHNPAERELVAYQVAELQALGLCEGEFEALTRDHKTLANADDTLLRCQRALGLLSGDDTQDIQSALQMAISTLAGAHSAAGLFENIISLLDQASIHIDEALPALQHHVDHFEADPARLAAIEQRLALLHDVARKHHVKPDALGALQAQLEANLLAMDNNEGVIHTLELAVAEALTHYHNQADRLSQSRRVAATALATQVTECIQTLGLVGGQFTLTFTTLSDEMPRVYGAEGVEFMVTTNPGQPLRPLHKVASGGELSRVALAIHVITANKEAQPCLIFDEVDVGIGGATAHTVGQALRQLGETTQVICVTHLAQVAAYAHQHCLAEKHHVEEATVSRLRLLTPVERVDEVARMMGAKTLTEQARRHANELLSCVE